MKGKRGQRKGSKNLTAAMFKKMKIVSDAGVSTKQLMDIFPFRGSTCSRIKSCDTWEDYVTLKRAHVAEVTASLQKKQAEENQPNLLVQPNGEVKVCDEEKKESDKIETPIFDVLVQIKEELQILNDKFVRLGKSKRFRLF